MTERTLRDQSVSRGEPQRGDRYVVTDVEELEDGTFCVVLYPEGDKDWTITGDAKPKLHSIFEDKIKVSE